MLYAKKGIRRIASLVLALILLLGFFGIELPARASDILPGKNDNGYITDIKFYQHTLYGTNYDEDSLVACAFDPATTDYDIKMITYDGIYNNAYVRIGVSDTSGDLWYRILIDGVPHNDKASWEQKFTAATYSKDLANWMKTYWPNDGGVHTLSVLVGTKYDSNNNGTINYQDEFETYDVYHFRVTNIPGLKTLSVADSEGTILQMIPAYVYGGNNRNFTVATEESAIQLSVAFTDGATLYISDKSYTEALTNEEIALAPFIPAGEAIAEIPLRLVNGAGEENTYYIKVLPRDYTPLIVTQPTAAVTCDKGDIIELSIEAQAPEGSSLSYQWYNLSGPIEGATEKSFRPDTSVALNGERYYCVVTNSVAGVDFTTQSNLAEVTVNLTYLNPPVYNVQPGTNTWQTSTGGGSWTGAYSTEYPENTSFDEMFLDVDNQEVANIGVVFYLNDRPSFDDAEVLAGTLRPYRSSASTNIFGFKADKLFPEGTYYVGCVVTFTSSDGALTASTNSEFVKLTFAPVPLDFAGSGTQADPYELRTAEDLQKLYEYNKNGKAFEYTYFKVTDDITLPADWSSIGAETAFAGDFDGAGHTISYAPDSKPLFDTVSATTIHDLAIYGERINGNGLIDGSFNTDGTLYLKNITLKTGSSTLKSGMAPGAGRAACRIAFEGCVVESGVTIGYSKDQSGIGSFVGALVGTLTDCRSAADVYGANRVGGLAGSNANSMGQCYFTGCVFSGSVTATGSNAGGIIGSGYEDATAPNTRLIRVDGCTMSGTVAGNANVGGLIGSEGGLQQSYDPASAGSVTGNTVTGTVTGSSNVGALAGLYSHLDRYTVFDNNTFPSAYSAFGKVYHVDTSAVQYGWHEGVFYFNSSEIYTDEQLEEIYTALYTGWEGTSRWKPSSLITARERSDNPLNSAAVKVSISVKTMPAKTEYVIGETFDPTGLVITATDVNGNTRELSESEYELSGFDSAEAGEKTITVTHGDAIVTFVVTVKAPEGAKITVKLSVLGDTKHNMEKAEEGHGLWVGGLTEWLAETEYEIPADGTAWDLLQKAFDADATLTLFSRFTEAYDSEYIYAVQKGSVKLEEKDNWPNSGWMIAVNGQHQQVGVSKMVLNEGDTVVLHWCDDFYTDEAAAQGGGTEKIIEVEDLIDAIGTVTLESEPAITAARAAYDALTAGQKDKVDNYAKLTAAEEALAALKADAEKVADAIAKIDAIGEVTTESEAAIAEARAAYDALTDEQKAQVTNYDALTAAEEALAALKADAEKVADAIAKIDTIGEVTADSEPAITAARAAYDALTDEQKAQVTNYDKLTAAEEAFAALSPAPEPVRQFAYSGDEVTFIAEDGSGFGMFSPQSGTEIVRNGDKVEITYLPKNTTVYSGFYFNLIGEESSGTFYAAGSDGSYKLTLGLEFCGKATAVKPIKVSDGGTTSKQYYLAIPAADKLPTAGRTDLFNDVQDESIYFFAPVYWAKDKGITTGTSPTTFEPYASCTRAQIVTFLWRAAGSPTVSGSNPFKDVKQSDWFYQAVLWANARGITTGTSKTTFSPYKACTREQAVTFLWRAAGSPGAANGGKFKDVKGGMYYTPAVYWALNNGITTGVSGTQFGVGQKCTRGQIVTFLYRFYGGN